MRPLAIIINGRGGCGKDSLIASAQKTLNDFIIENVSAIDPIKRIMKETTDWDGQSKTEKDRAFMHDLKMAYVRYCDLPNNFLLKSYLEFEKKTANLVFMHCREPEEIERLRNLLINNDIPVKTMLIVRNDGMEHHYGNHADDDVEKYNYEITFDNSQALNITSSKFAEIIRKLIS